ncbi:hypothetical protein [Yoonia sp. SS1-5]|uniref:Uncharacterized protein n=1 Tax=Yoonia rhodophyticola TaxID=3137370 RepID=A0AAN0NLJ1_9RHOB
MNPRYVPARYFLIALVPILIFAQEAFITTQFLAMDLAIPATVIQDGRDWLEAVGRFRFLGATWVFAALAVMVFVLVIRDIAQPMRPQTRRVAILVILGIFLLAMMPTVQYIIAPETPRIFHRLGADLFENALGRGTIAGCATPADRWLFGPCGEQPVITLLNRTLDMINICAGLGVGALIVGMILCLDVPQTDDLEKQAQHLERNLRRMRRQLYLSGLVLTFGIFFATSWMRWPLPMIGAADQDAFGAVVAASSLFTGIYFTLLILSFYLPVALVLDGRRRRLTLRAAGEGQLRDPAKMVEWQKMRGLASDPAEVFRSGFALAAPILAAFAGGVPLAV